MQLSVIILNYNVRFFLELCVLSVQAAIKNLDAEIIVVDNNSTDDSCLMIKSRFPNIKLIENQQNTGFPKGNNIGVKAAAGDFICILNPDTVVAEDTFEKILYFLKNNLDISNSNPIIHKIGLVGCKLVDGTGHFLPESKRGIPTPFVAFTKIFGLYKMSNYFGKYYAQHLPQNQSGKVDILVGAFMVVQKSLYEDVGGFDENCFMYSDDIDLSYMVLKHGFENYYFHDTTVIHFKGESTFRDGLYMSRFREAMNFFYKKHFKTSIFFDVLMKIGIVLFSFIKKSQAKNDPSISPKSYILVSDNTDLKHKLAYTLQKPLSMQVETNFIVQNNQTEIIFDNNFIDFKSIISSMENHKNKNFTFKIRPKSSDFIIGSNNSNGRGEVIMIN